MTVNPTVRFRIATWNLERPKQNGWMKNQRRLNQIHQVDADVWVLTETNAAIATSETPIYNSGETAPAEEPAPEVEEGTL